MNDNLTETDKEFSLLKTKNYGKTYNLCDHEPFNHQPVAAGRTCTGFLVKEDVIATAAHFAHDASKLRFVFGFKMADPSSPVTQVPNKNIYKGTKFICRVHNRTGDMADWALVKLDRKVEGHAVAKLSENNISCDRPVYVIGHPCGLPLKYAPGAKVRDVQDAYFGADLDVYSGNSGSPVFDSASHEVVGIVVRGDNRDFRWSGECWLSVIYPCSGSFSKVAQCTRVSEFVHLCRKTPETRG